MGWIAPSGVPAVTGARWSAGAYWAEAADPQVTDSAWEDPADWPRSHPGTAERIALGVFVGGVDLTYWAQALSWLTGTEEAFPTTIPMGSANLTFRNDAPAAAVGDRVVLVTEYETLWAGRIESADVKSAPGLPDAVTYSAVDDLERAAQVQLEGFTIGGTLFYAVGQDPPYGDGRGMEQLLKASGLPGPQVNNASGVAPVTCPHALGFPDYMPAAHDGSALEIMGEALARGGYMGSYSPAGLAVRSVGLWIDEDQELALEDCRDTAASWAESRAVSDVITRVEGYGLEQAAPAFPLAQLTEGAWTITLRPAARSYGKRTVAVSSEDWPAGDLADQVRALLGIIVTDYMAPFDRVQASYRVTDTDSEAHRLTPFARMQQDSDDWYVKRISHAVTVDEWRVDVAAFPAVAVAGFTANYPYTTAALDAALGAR